MAEEKKFHLATETSLGFIEGDLYLKIDGNKLDGTFNAFGVEMHLQNGSYDNGHIKGSFNEVLLLTPVEGTIEGDIDGDKCVLQMTTASGTRTLKSM